MEWECGDELKNYEVDKKLGQVEALVNSMEGKFPEWREVISAASQGLV